MKTIRVIKHTFFMGYAHEKINWGPEAQAARGFARVTGSS